MEWAVDKAMGMAVESVVVVDLVHKAHTWVQSKQAHMEMVEHLLCPPLLTVECSVCLSVENLALVL